MEIELDLRVLVHVAIPDFNTVTSAECYLCSSFCPNFLEHIKTCHENPAFMCGVCGSFFDSKDAVSFHVLNLCAHGESKPALQGSDERCYELKQSTLRTDIKEEEQEVIHGNTLDETFSKNISTDCDSFTEEEEESDINDNYNSSASEIMEPTSKVLRGNAYSLSCNKCKKKFTSEKLHDLHECIEEGQDKYKNEAQDYKDNDNDFCKAKHYEHFCRKCGAKFSSFSLLRRHKITHSDARPYSCEICGAKFKRFLNLKEHTERHKGLVRSFSCEICGAKFRRKGTLTDHLAVHTSARPHSCKKCSKTFRFKTHLRIHLKSHRTEKSRTKKISHGHERPFCCEVCDAKFKRHSSLKEHRSIHTDEKPHICEFCGKFFRLKSFLNNHLKAVHGMGKRRINKASPVSCSICSKLCSDEAHLKMHLIKHTNVNQEKKLCQCDQCGVSLSSPSVMKRHQATVHSDIKPFVCPVCERAFKRKHHLKKHESIHTGEKPYTCQDCGKCFRNTTNLNQHLKIHKKEKRRENETQVT